MMQTHSSAGALHFDAAVVGGGPAGLAAAIALAAAGVATALIARRGPYADNRTTALLGSSVDLLRRLGIWDDCAPEAAPLRVMRLVDDTDRLLRAPEVHFDCGELGLDAFGYNIENRLLVAAMEARAAALPRLARFDTDADAIEIADDIATIRCADGETLTAALLVGADGRHSMCRNAAGITVRRRALAQSALTFNVAHTRPHRDISTEFHTAFGPCVFVPLTGSRSSVVWVTSPSEAERLKSVDDDDLSREIERRAHSHLGRMTVEGARHVFPLAYERPDRLAARRVALVGEAAHVVPPIGAQGLNLGLRDAEAIAQLAADAIASGSDPGSDAVLERYRRSRRLDVAGRDIVIDIANRTLLADFLPVQVARAAGMQLIGGIGALRRAVMRTALDQRSAASPPRPDAPHV